MDLMLVEDDPLVRETIAEELLLAGIGATTTICAEHALKVADSIAYPPSIVVTDIDLGPGLNGFELASALRQRWPEVKFIYITGRWNSLHAASLGQHERYLLKPFAAARLIALVRELLGCKATSAASPSTESGRGDATSYDLRVLLSERNDPCAGAMLKPLSIHPEISGP